MDKSKNTPKIYTLGCRVNQYESEAISALTANADIPDNRRIVIVNTCSVTGEADRKSRQTVRRAIKENPEAIVIVTGCAAQANPEEFSAIEGVYAVIGNAKKLDTVKAAQGIVCDGSSFDLRNTGFEEMSISAFKRTRAYLKIEDGCESHCTYCIIPSVRGKIRSKRPEDVIDEAKRLIDGGCAEIVLTGVETSAYQYGLTSLIASLDKLDGIKRIRLGSLDPSSVRDSFVSEYAACEHTMPHFHLSMQSGCNNTLFAMRRKYNIETVEKYIGNIREKIPNVCFSADVICGFPGETDEDFASTVEFFRRNHFLHLHIFPYSERPGTEAADMKNQLPPSVRRERAEYLSGVQNEIKKIELERVMSHPDGNGFHHVLIETVTGGRLLGHNESFAEFSVCAENIAHPQLLRGKTVSIKAISQNGGVISAVLCR